LFKEFESAFNRTASIVKKIKKATHWKAKAALMKELKQSDADQQEARNKLESVYGTL
jgi:hypothetical protein